MSEVPEIKLGDHRCSAERGNEIYVRVDGIPTWRAAQWEERCDYLCSRDGMKALPFHVLRPILGEGEIVRETVERVVGIVTIRA